MVAGASASGQELEPAPSTAIEPEPEPPLPPDTGMDDEDGERALAPPPAGAQFCFGLDEARSLAASEEADEASACPVELKLGEVRERVESWDRWTGGPWDESVKFVVSDAPEGEGLRCCYEHAYARVPGRGRGPGAARRAARAPRRRGLSPAWPRRSVYTRAHE